VSSKKVESERIGSRKVGKYAKARRKRNKNLMESDEFESERRSPKVEECRGIAQRFRKVDRVRGSSKKAEEELECM
jgi:hypothetical protein